MIKKGFLSNLSIAWLWSIIGIIAYIFYTYAQPLTSVNYGFGWDGLGYTIMFNYFYDMSDINFLAFPFNQRPVFPYLASLISKMLGIDIFSSFKILHLVSIALNVFLIAKLLEKLKINKLYISFLMFWFIFHWIGFARVSNNYPISIDTLSMLALTLLLYIIYYSKYIFLIPLAITATGIKEQMIALFGILLVIEIFKNFISKTPLFNKSILYIAISFIISLFINYYTNHILFPVSPESSSAGTLFKWIKIHLDHPLDFIRYLVAFFIAFGSFGLLFLYYIRDNICTLSNINNSLIIFGFSIVFFIFGFTAGSDMERIMWQGFPFMAAIFSVVINQLNRLYVSIIFIFSIPLLRVTNYIPEITQALPKMKIPPKIPMIYDSVPGDTIGAYSWMAEYMEIGQVAAWGIYMVFIWILITKLQFLNQKMHQ